MRTPLPPRRPPRERRHFRVCATPRSTQHPWRLFACGRVCAKSHQPLLPHALRTPLFPDAGGTGVGTPHGQGAPRSENLVPRLQLALLTWVCKMDSAPRVPHYLTWGS